MTAREEKSTTPIIGADLVTAEIGATGSDWRVLVHVRVIDWLNANVRNKSARDELVIAYHTWHRRGSFSIHQGRVDACHGSTTRKAIRQAMADCPYIRQIAPGKIKKHSAIWQFFGIDRRHKNQPTDSGSVRRPRSRFVWLSSGWLRRRAIRWCTWCELRDYRIACDFFGIGMRAKKIFETFSLVGLPFDNSFLLDIDDEKNEKTGMSKRDWATWFLRKCKSGSLLRVARYQSGRVYHSLTNVPKIMRRQMTIAGDPMTEVDLQSAYWVLLAGTMPHSPERDRMIDSLLGGRWYEDLAEAAGVEYPDRKFLKVDVQRQCLTGRDQRLSSRPIWVAMRRLYPMLAGRIQRLRDDRGASGITHYLTELEGRVMGEVHLRLIDMGIAVLPLHDAVLVPLSAASRVAEVIRSVAEDHLGFRPVVTAK